MARVNPTGLPMIYAGDFNAGVHRAYSPGVLMNAAGFTDSVTVSQPPPINATFNSGHTYSTTPALSAKVMLKTLIESIGNPAPTTTVEGLGQSLP